MNGSKISAFKETFCFFVCRKSSLLVNVFDQGKVSLIKFFMKNFFVENYLDCRKSPWLNFLWKISLIVKNFLDQVFCEKFPWLWKICLINYFLEKFLDCEKFPWSNFLWKISLIMYFVEIFLTVENFLDCGKIPWSRKFSLTVKNVLSKLILKIIGLIILKRVRHIFWLESRNLIWVDKINVIFNRRLKPKY